jgi:hypothetical protein
MLSVLSLRVPLLQSVQRPWFEIPWDIWPWYLVTDLCTTFQVQAVDVSPLMMPFAGDRPPNLYLNQCDLNET